MAEWKNLLKVGQEAQAQLMEVDDHWSLLPPPREGRNQGDTRKTEKGKTARAGYETTIRISLTDKGPA